MAFSVEKAFELIQSAHERGRLAHAFLITGPKGSGKEALAAQMADLLNGEDDAAGGDLWGDPVAKEAPTLGGVEGEFVRVIRPRSKSRIIRVEEMRGIEKMMNQSAPRKKWKIGVIVDADRMNESSENAFLKTLEEPPGAKSFIAPFRGAGATSSYDLVTLCSSGASEACRCGSR